MNEEIPFTPECKDSLYNDDGSYYTKEGNVVTLNMKIKVTDENREDIENTFRKLLEGRK